MRILIPLWVLVTFLGASRGAPGYHWAVPFGGTSNEICTAMVVDGSGCSYVAFASASQQVTIGGLTVPITPNYTEGVIVKLDSAGAPLWAHTQTDTSIGAMAVDAEGNLYAAGTFMNAQLAFGGTNLTKTGYNNGFVARFQSNGTPVAVAQIIGFAVMPQGLTVSGTNVVVAVNIVAGTATCGSMGVTNTDCAVFALSTGMEPLYALPLGSGAGLGEVADIRGLCMDSAGSFFIAGTFPHETFMIGTNLLNSGWKKGNGFLARFAGDGNCLWAKTLASTNFVFVDGIASLTDGGIAVLGNVHHEWEMSGRVLSAGTFVARFDSEGNLLWVVNPWISRMTSIASDSRSNIYVAGRFVLNESLANLGTLVVAKFRSTGALAWLAKSEPQGDATITHQGPYIQIDSHDAVYMSGGFEDSWLFGASAIESRGGSDIFLARLATEQPRLTIMLNSQTVIASWSTNFAGYTLQTSTDLKHWFPAGHTINTGHYFGSQSVSENPVLFFRLAESASEPR